MKGLGLAALLLLAGCSADKTKVKSLLERNGCTETVVYGWSPFAGCDDRDEFVNKFSCNMNHLPTTGVVCSGWFKGFTIRYD